MKILALLGRKAIVALLLPHIPFLILCFYFYFLILCPDQCTHCTLPHTVPRSIAQGARQNTAALHLPLQCNERGCAMYKGYTMYTLYTLYTQCAMYKGYTMYIVHIIYTMYRLAANFECSILTQCSAMGMFYRAVSL